VEKALITEGLYSADGITEDPADDMFVACALEAQADYIVARDPHLRNLKHIHGIQIIDVTTFIEESEKKIKAVRLRSGWNLVLIEGSGHLTTAI
jgi:hypothetical protein